MRLGLGCPKKNARIAGAVSLISIFIGAAIALASMSYIPLSYATSPGENGRIAAETGCGIITMNQDGSEKAMLSDGSGPKWSPDGGKIAFTRLEGNQDIFVMNADGTGITNLTKDPSSVQASPSWSPDGKKIAFYSQTGYLTYDIIVMNADGTGIVNLTKGGNGNINSSPSWSPDGKKIAFVRLIDGQDDILTMNADGTDVKNLTNTPSMTEFSPSWSPDGTKIAFTVSVNLTLQIYVMNSDGTNKENLSNNQYFDRDPSWSPDGTKIAFDSTQDGLENIFTMNADGTGRIGLHIAAYTPDWGTSKLAPLQPPKENSTITVNAVDQSGKMVQGVWTVVTSFDTIPGTIVKAGYTPLKFEAHTGSPYDVYVANYDGKQFQHWDDNGTYSTHSFYLCSDSTFTATYDTGDSLRGYSPLTFTGTSEQQDLTVNAVKIDGDSNLQLHMYTIIDPLSTDAVSSTTTYKLYAGNYQNLVFDHWSDGNADSVRELTIDKPMTLTAYYRAE